MQLGAVIGCLFAIIITVIETGRIGSRFSIGG